MEEHTVTEETIKNTIRAFLAALSARELEKTLSFLAEDATWVTPASRFKGKAAVRRYLAWEFEMVPALTITETGAGLMVEGNQALIEHAMTGTIRGKRCQWLGMCAYEFRDGKIREMRAVYDRLTLAQQSTTGWLASKIVGAVAGQVESGLD
jgi:ketosteroid isomerase-like protein